MLSQVPSHLSNRVMKVSLKDSKTDRNLYNFNKDLLKTKYGFPASKRLAHVHKRSIKFGYHHNT